MNEAKQENLLYYGDNLDVMQRHIKDESVDLVYLAAIQQQQGLQGRTCSASVTR